MTAAVGDNATDKADVVDKYDISEHTEYLPLVPDPAGAAGFFGFIMATFKGRDFTPKLTLRTSDLEVSATFLGCPAASAGSSSPSSTNIKAL
ncbi:hypothetical protein CYMTET_27536 [Cymbomonas tetramitiformis]|uniref:Uncharacterized protein n=1 Tax=Cymbomonas tetramitiformis TaxID=36881 RepID=A0AAE0FR78_9CHLO|nr:hypothetical protein CYMTET_27536 [Cymbomonas tetramitiformis]